VPPRPSSNKVQPQSAQQRGSHSDAADGPKPSSVLFKTPPSKYAATNQNAGDGSHVTSDQIAADNVAHSRTPSGDSPKTLSPTKNIYASQDTTTTTNGALTSVEPYPREV